MFKASILIDILIVYSIVTLLVYTLSNGMIFQPPFPTYEDTKDIIKLTTKNGKKISAMFLENNSSDHVILYSHGNASDLGWIKDRIKQFHKNGYSIFAYDYQGYGTSEGVPGERNTYMDIQAAYDYLVNYKNINPKKIIALGVSVGAGPTLELASKNEVGGVILESPFYTAFRVVTVIPFFPVDKFMNNKKIPHINAPVLIFHGVKDKTTPVFHSRKLYEVAVEPKKYVEVKNAGHNDVREVMGREFWQKVKEFTIKVK